MELLALCGALWDSVYLNKCVFFVVDDWFAFLSRAESERQTNLCALHGLQQVAQRVSEGANKDPTELLKQSPETCDGCPETHTYTWKFVEYLL